MKCMGIIFVVFLISSCGNASEKSEEKALSNGLKIFVTSETHVANYSNDPNLIGSNAIEKADDFCQKSVDRPDDSIYKAMLVDGIDRDAISLTNWVLQPNVTYYRPYNDVVIGETSDTAIFASVFANLQNSISGVNSSAVFTGIGDPVNFSSVDRDNCNRWSTLNSSTGAITGNPTALDETAFFSIATGCSGKLGLYCVEQP